MHNRLTVKDVVKVFKRWEVHNKLQRTFCSSTNGNEIGFSLDKEEIFPVLSHCPSSKLLLMSGSLSPSFSTAGPRPGTGPWHQLYRAARGLRNLQYATIFH